VSPRHATIYTVTWVLFSVGALALCVRRRSALLLCQRKYWIFLGRPWALVTFVVALLGFMVLSPYSGDPTWDWVDAGFMSLLTFCTAPYALGVVVRGLRGQTDKWQLWPAVACWLLSASWLYDAYILWRDGFYPPTWWANLIASSILYFGGGAFWSLTVRSGRGLTFAFLEPQWIDTQAEKLSPRMLLAVVLGVLLVVGMMMPFLLEAWERAGLSH
jgi:hypothetical protein